MNLEILEHLVPGQSPGCIGAVMRLLCHACLSQDCTLPNNEDKLKELIRATDSDWEASRDSVFALFKPIPDFPNKLEFPWLTRMIFIQRAILWDEYLGELENREKILKTVLGIILEEQLENLGL